MIYHLFFRLILIFSIAVHYQISAEQLSVQTYSMLPEVSMVRISPDGDRFVYRAVIDEEDYLIIKDIDSGKTLGGFSLGRMKPLHVYFVTQDKIIFIGSTFKKTGGGEGYNLSTAFIHNLTTKETEPLLVPGRKILRNQTGLGSVVGFSPDRKFAFMPAYQGKEVSAPALTLMSVNLDNPRRLTTHKRGSRDTIDYFVDERGEVIARELYNNNSNEHYIESFINNDWVKIFSEKVEIREKSFVGLTPDRKSLVMVANHGDEHNAYYSMSLIDGSISDPIFGRDDASISSVITDKQRVVYGVRYSGFQPDYAFFDKKLTATFQAIQKIMPNNTFRIVDKTDDWKNIIFFVEGDGTSGNYMLFSSGEFSLIASARPEITGEQVAPVRKHSFSARDGLTIPTLVTYPLQHLQKPKNLPTIVLPHGGPQSHDQIGFDWLSQYFANRGYVVIQPQFRGSSGFGYEHTSKGHGEWGKKMQDDLTDAVSHFAEKGLVDKDNVCIVGWSYGGYAALAGAVFTPELYRCVIAINSVTDVHEMMKRNTYYRGKNHWVISYWNKIIRDKNLGEDYLKTISPVYFAENVKAPILLIHSEQDKVVPIEQSEEMADALDDEDKVFQYIEIEDEGHSINNSNNSRLQVLTAIDAFLTKYMN